ncbi:molybdopterin molybdotransferase MoeA [Candidatus Magnetomonas plexicatena]|nr:molybdopterin molybdotransferase MoeA [Nitrospirales bacterium LBB_01]
MLGRVGLISVAAAKELINSVHYAVTGVDTVRLENSVGRVLASDIKSNEDLPAFSRSTMDGYALRSSDTFGATESVPAYLNVKHEVFMGKMPDFKVNTGESAKIPTGGMLPDGADSVLMLEHTQKLNDDMIEVVRAVAPKDNTVSRGEDVKTGELIFKKGHQLRPQDAGVLAALGISKVTVFKLPKVAIISTGDEIVPPEGNINPGQVRDINAYTLAALVKVNGGESLIMGIYRDDFDTMSEALSKSLNSSDMVLLTGGSSVGTMDLTPKIINSLGLPGVIFHGVAIKPGKPTIFGVVNEKPVFGLPGHPSAVMVAFDVFVKGALRKLSGLTEDSVSEYAGRIRAHIAKNISSMPGREDHIWVKVETRDGKLWAIPILGKSGLINTMVKADGFIVIGADKRGISEGDFVDVRLFQR